MSTTGTPRWYTQTDAPVSSPRSRLAREHVRRRPPSRSRRHRAPRGWPCRHDRAPDVRIGKPSRDATGPRSTPEDRGPVAQRGQCVSSCDDWACGRPPRATTHSRDGRADHGDGADRDGHPAEVALGAELVHRPVEAPEDERAADDGGESDEAAEPAGAGAQAGQDHHDAGADLDQAEQRRVVPAEHLRRRAATTARRDRSWRRRRCRGRAMRRRPARSGSARARSRARSPSPPPDHPRALLEDGVVAVGGLERRRSARSSGTSHVRGSASTPVAAIGVVRARRSGARRTPAASSASLRRRRGPRRAARP